MQRLGRVLNVTPSQNLIAKTEKTPKIGLTVVDENLKVIGKVFDIIGPVSAPYAVIKPAVRDPERVVNKQVYLLLSKERRNVNE